MEVLYGLHPVEEAVKAGRRHFDHVLVAQERHDERLERLVTLCREAGVRVRQKSRDQLTQLAQTPAALRNSSPLRTSSRPPRQPPALPACCWLSMASKTRRISAPSCAWPMEPVWTVSC
jgi:hypothetical protein